MIPKQTVNMHDVAQRLGVSISTVSRALRGLPGVSEATRERIVREARELSYTLPQAGAPREGGPPRVGVAVFRVDMWFYSTVLAGVERVLRAAGCQVELWCLPTAHDMYELFERLPRRADIDAVIAVSVPLDTRSESRLRSLGVPAVTVGFAADALPHVMVDDHRAASLSVDHLIKAGHRRIGLIHTADEGYLRGESGSARADGYRAALAAAGIEPDDTLVASVPWGIEGGAEGMELLLSAERPPTAVFCYSDEVAIGAMRTLRRLGLTVPGAMSITAVDDHPMAELMDLTTVRQPVAEQGAAAAELVVEMLGGGPPRDVVLPTRLVVRHSTRPLE